jgi:hypothetical protein
VARRRYRPDVPPSLLAALGLSLRAISRSPWLVAAGMGVALLGRALAWPAWAVGGALLSRAASLAIHHAPFDPVAPFRGALDALGSPAFVAVVGGLWLSGLAARGLLRVAWLAGALPQLGSEMAGERFPRFAAGMAWGLAPLLGVAGLGFLTELGGTGFGVALALGALQVAGHASEQGGSAPLAAATAAVLVLALVVPLALTALADAAVARAALRGEGPAAAFAGATRRFLSRPGTFVLAALAFAVVGSLGPASVRGLAGLATGFAPGAAPLVLAGPSLMLAAAAMGVAAAVDLGWLGTVAALACARARPQR